MNQSWRAGQKVPAAGSSQHPLPWHLWAVLLFGVALLLTTHFLSSATLDFSTPTLRVHDHVCSVSFQAFNRSKQPVSATLRVVAENCQLGSGKPVVFYYRTLADASLPVSLAAHARGTFACDLVLAQTDEVPNRATVTVTTFHR